MRGNGVRVAVIHPGGIKTNIVRNARFHADDAGSSRPGATVRAASTSSRARRPSAPPRSSTPASRSGNPRIRIGADAVVMDWIVRIAPVRYFDVIERVLNRMSPDDDGRQQ